MFTRRSALRSAAALAALAVALPDFAEGPTLPCMKDQRLAQPLVMAHEQAATTDRASSYSPRRSSISRSS